MSSHIAKGTYGDNFFGDLLDWLKNTKELNGEICDDYSEAEILAMDNPEAGIIYYATDTRRLYYYNEGKWFAINRYHHVLASPRKPNISYDEYNNIEYGLTYGWKDEEVLQIIAHTIIEQIKCRIKGIRMKTCPVDTEERSFDREFYYQCYMDDEQSTIYIYYKIPDDLLSFIQRGTEKLVSIINNEIITNIQYLTGFSAKIISPKQFKDKRNDDWIGTSKELLKLYTTRLWKNKTNNSLEFIYDRQLFNSIVKPAEMLYENNYKEGEEVKELNDPNDILTFISDKIIQLNSEMKNQFASINERNREDGTKLNTDDIIRSTYNQYRRYLSEEYNISIKDILPEEAIKYGMIEYEYAYSYRIMLAVNAESDFYEYM